jgi:DNA-binding winged helix-turn-helix (wHTH) protein/TolB-like protein/Tfp pilus assembly protein PilF
MKSAAPAQLWLWRFGIYELDESAGELRRGGTLIHLSPQPLQILKLLLSHAGQVVDREQIRREVWGDVAVDFDRSLNVAIAQIRSALNDDAASPRFVQTVPRRGYRFVAEVECAAPVIAVPVRIRGSVRRVWIVAAVVLAVTAAAALGTLRYWRGPSRPVRIAVLPFENLSLDSTQSTASDGLFDDLLTRLGGTQPDRIEVIGRRSVSGVDARGPGSIRELGKRLNVNYVLESSARREGESLRIASRLVETSGEAVRWSAAFAQDGAVEAFEQTVLARISAGVLTALFAGASAAGSANFCADGRDAYETGRMLVNRGSLHDLERSLDYFRKAGCPQARAETAEILVRMARIGSPPGSWESAREAASSALKADGGIARAHLAMGNVAFWHDWNWNAAEREFREALRINPSNPDAHHDLAWLQIAMGRRGDALASLDTAIALDPVSARTRIDSAWLLLQVGQFARAGAEARRALELNPGMNEARLCLSRALLYAGDTRAAADAVRPLMPAAALAGEIAALAPAAAFRRLVEFHAASAASDPYERAWLMAWLGSRAEALSALEEAYAKRSLMMPLIASDPAFRGLRDHPRFRAVLRRMALSE